MRRQKLPFLSLVTITLIAAVTLILLNPFNWFVKNNELFTLTKFSQIKPGMGVARVIELVGEPLRVVTHEDYVQDCGLNCKTYYFMGDPPSWLISFTEAWVVVDSNNHVVYKVLNREP